MPGVGQAGRQEAGRNPTLALACRCSLVTQYCTHETFNIKFRCCFSHFLPTARATALATVWQSGWKDGRFGQRARTRAPGGTLFSTSRQRCALCWPGHETPVLARASPFRRTAILSRKRVGCAPRAALGAGAGVATPGRAARTRVCWAQTRVCRPPSLGWPAALASLKGASALPREILRRRDGQPGSGLAFVPPAPPTLPPWPCCGAPCTLSGLALPLRTDGPQAPLCKAPTVQKRAPDSSRSAPDAGKPPHGEGAEGSATGVDRAVTAARGLRQGGVRRVQRGP